jgi:hypothetical protein
MMRVKGHVLAVIVALTASVAVLAQVPEKPAFEVAGVRAATRGTLESLGLKLEERRPPFDVVVVDKIDQNPVAD